MRAIHAAKSGKPEEVNHHICTALWLLEQYDAPAGELSKLREWAKERIDRRRQRGYIQKGRVQKIDGGDEDQEDPSGGGDEDQGDPSGGGDMDQEVPFDYLGPGRVSLEEVIAWTTKRFEAVMATEDEGAQSAGTIEAAKFAWCTRHVSLLDMPPDSLPMVRSSGGLANEDALRDFVSQNYTKQWLYLIEVAVHVQDPALMRAIFHNMAEKYIMGWMTECNEIEAEGWCKSFIHFLYQSYCTQGDNAYSCIGGDNAYRCIEVIMDVSMQLKEWGDMFLTGVDPINWRTTLHLAVEAGNKKWIEACVKVGIKASFLDKSGKLARDLTDDTKIKKFLDITVRSKEDIDKLEADSEHDE